MLVKTQVQSALDKDVHPEIIFSINESTSMGYLAGEEVSRGEL